MEQLIWLAGLGIFVWLAVLSLLLFRTLVNYNRLTQGVSERTLSEILNQFLQQEKTTEQALVKVGSDLVAIRQEARRYIQKIGLVRFNPFSDTGGDQSFVLALLDTDNNGIILTSLFARTGVRWYVKTIRKGKGLEHELSNEEQEALKKATRKV